jgi:hypothetical protein
MSAMRCVGLRMMEEYQAARECLSACDEIVLRAMKRGSDGTGYLLWHDQRA